MTDRLAVVDGRMFLSSPAGGPDCPPSGDAVQSHRLVIAEDAALLREGLVSLLERCGHTVLAAVGDAPALIVAVEEHEPDAVVVDVRMPPNFSDDGLVAARTLRAARPHLGVLVLSQYVSQTYATELLQSDSGAGIGYLLKDRIGDVEEFISALDRVVEGGTVVDPEVVRQLLSRRHDPLQRLSPREREVLGLSPRAGPTRRSPDVSSSRRRRCPSVSRASSPNWTCLPRRTTIAGFSRYWRT